METILNGRVGDDLTSIDGGTNDGSYIWVN